MTTIVKTDEVDGFHMCAKCPIRKIGGPCGQQPVKYQFPDPASVAALYPPKVDKGSTCHEATTSEPLLAPHGPDLGNTKRAKPPVAPLHLCTPPALPPFPCVAGDDDPTAYLAHVSPCGGPPPAYFAHPLYPAAPYGPSYGSLPAEPEGLTFDPSTNNPLDPSSCIVDPALLPQYMFAPSPYPSYTLPQPVGYWDPALGCVVAPPFYPPDYPPPMKYDGFNSFDANAAGAVDPRAISPNSGSSSPPHSATSAPRRDRRNAKQRDPLYVPRPANPFICFRQDWLKRLQRGEFEYKGPRDQRNMSFRISADWNGLSEVEKNYFRTEAATRKAIHARKYPHYKFAPKPKDKKTTPVVESTTSD